MHFVNHWELLINALIIVCQRQIYSFKIIMYKQFFQYSHFDFVIEFSFTGMMCNFMFLFLIILWSSLLQNLRNFPPEKYSKINSMNLECFCTRNFTKSIKFQTFRTLLLLCMNWIIVLFTLVIRHIVLKKKIVQSWRFFLFVVFINILKKKQTIKWMWERLY